MAPIPSIRAERAPPAVAIFRISRAPSQRSGSGAMTLGRSAASFIDSNMLRPSLLITPSVPSATGTPLRSNWATGAIPLPSLRLLTGRWQVIAPVASRMSMSPGVAEGDPGAQRPAISQPLDQRLAVDHAAHGRLRPGLQGVDVHRHVALL